MNEVLHRHEMSPCVYEEQTMILEDRAGNRDVRQARRYCSVKDHGTARFLLVFDSPAEVRGVAILATGQGAWEMYLPALGRERTSRVGAARVVPFLGTDYTLEDLYPPVPSAFDYLRAPDQRIEDAAHYVIDAVPQDEEAAKKTGYGFRRHFIRQDNFFVVRTDYFDLRRRFFKRQTFHDLKRVDGDLWHAGMMVMENRQERHRTLIRVNRRVLSCDYVRPEMFTSAWLLENRHVQSSERDSFRGASGALAPSESSSSRPVAGGHKKENG